MGALGVWALAIGVADLVAPARPTMETPDAGAQVRGRLAVLTLLVIGGLGAVTIGLPWLEAGLLVVVTAVSGVLWLVLWQRDSQGAGLTILAVTFASLLVSAGWWDPGDVPIATVLEASPFVPLVTGEYVVLVVGLAVLLTAAGNRIVRVLLAQVEPALPGQEQQLKGGRVIGPLERLLIFGLGISGQLVAAGLIVTAKSLLRFGELRHRGIERDLDAPARAELMSEYLLIGSLLSWALAFGAMGVAALASG